MNINTIEVIRYLGATAQNITKEQRDEIEEISKDVEKDAEIKTVIRTFSYHDKQLENTNFTLQGKDITNMLKDSHEVILIGATVGNKIEQKTRQLEIMDLSKAIIYDTCASVLIESVVNTIHGDLLQTIRKKGLFLTDRFSPGYGDFPLAQQKEVASVLDLHRTIGVTLNHGLMIPRKSITALIGISTKKQAKRYKGCANCYLKDECSFRQKGVKCE